MAVKRRKNPASVVEAHPLNQLDFLTVELYWDNEGREYVTRIPELLNISTCGASEEEALDNTAEMLVGWMDAMEDVGTRIPLTKAQVREVRQTLHPVDDRD